MKKQALAALAILGATMGMGATPQVVPQQNQNQQQRTNEALEKTPVTVRQGRATALNPTGSMPVYFDDKSMSPKEYGQMLQRTGRQKWNKKK